MKQGFIQSSMVKKDPQFEAPLRPQTFDEFIGQRSLKERLEVLIGAARARGETLCHCLFSGPPGLGKTTIAHILAKAMGTRLVTTSGPVLEKGGDLAGILTNLKEGDVLFIDEIHALSRSVEEYLYGAMEDYAIDLVIDAGPNARSVQLPLPRFTLCGATTRIGRLSEPFRTRFGFVSRLDYYTPELLTTILQRTACVLHVAMDADAAMEIAVRSRGTPRVANHLLKWVRDFAQIRANHYITLPVAKSALDLLAIDSMGLDEIDLKMLRVMVEHYEGGPVGLNTIAASIGEEEKTVEEVLEPYLLQIGYLQRTPKGRLVTLQGRRHLEK